MTWKLFGVLVCFTLPLCCFAVSIEELCQASKTGDLPRVQALLTADHTLATAWNANDRTALHCAADAGQVQVAEYLLAHGAEIDPDYRHTQTPFMLAVAGGNARMAELMLRYHAALAPANWGFDAIGIALRQRNTALVQVLLNHGVSANRKIDNDYPPLRSARLLRLNPTIIRLLVEHGARDDTHTSYFFSALPAPYLHDGVSMIPAPPLTAWFGAACYANTSGKKVTIVLGQHAVTFSLHARSAVVDGKSFPLPAAPEIHEGVFYVPLIGVIRGLRLPARWDGHRQQWKLDHPSTREVLIVAMVDPDPPNRRTARRGRYAFFEHSLNGMGFLFNIWNGKIPEQSGLGENPYPARIEKVYSLTRYVGTRSVENRDAFTNINYLYRPHTVSSDQPWFIGFSGAWNAMPRAPRIDSPMRPLYQQAAQVMLQAHGLNAVPVRITRVVLIDLDGDGRNEVLMSGAYDEHPDWGHDSQYYRKSRLFYNFTGLWRHAGGKMVPVRVEGLYAKYQLMNHVWYALTGVLDVNNDGVMEYIVASDHYGQDSAYNLRTVYRFSGNKVAALADYCWGE